MDLFFLICFLTLYLFEIFFVVYKLSKICRCVIHNIFCVYLLQPILAIELEVSNLND